ncbi:hypothetical protein EM77_023070 [Vibrio parahaemolyticus]|uniref:hypothetical protein n=1 Tax=Vibrio parahaemolyticus TaxID=670 RepID=UPI0004D7ED30|nr:hypothetical protein [Vibrio parahaemolyticus]EGR0229157.1 hypothetical protein [Vibrio parahaemolyticus]EGR1364122.1 hypothetical protein [Vibrio parahaemolyticus]EGR9060647.1 hypothetical protein [Vibrio parahaemolyticus]EGU1088588.1 hypothetical protein [Vibrio parahaemolyticus]EIF5145442.1 hypothetical protein [Vibrio parahaemolyticus]
MPQNQNRRKDVMYCLVSPNTDSQTQLTLARYQLIYSILGLLLGLLALASGAYLFILGITGETNWSLTIFGNESNIVNAAPGAILFIVGLFLVVVTRFKFKHIQPK